MHHYHVHFPILPVLIDRAGNRAGLHLSIHAIGDKANHLLLDAYERLIQINGQKDRRVRIEHAQHLRCAFAWPQACPQSPNALQTLITDSFVAL